MAASAVFTDDLLTNIDSQQLEIFCIIWLDDNAQVGANRDTEQGLRSIINRLKRFKDVDRCEKYINERMPEDRLILIVSGQLGRKIVPTIHIVRQVISIYVYCMDEASNREWSKKYPKVKAVVTELDKLVSRIKSDHKVQQIIEQPLSINIFTSGKSTGDVDGKFVFSQVLIDCLLRLKSNQDDTNELIKHCRKVYEGNKFELNNIREFQKEYSPDKAVRWYTRDTFFFKTLNAVLRTESIHMIFLFRAYIADIQRQLKTHQLKESLRVYRGQLISNDELKTLQKSCGQFISVNSFFSTSTEVEQARFFLNAADKPENLERALFEIVADPKSTSTKPFADISSLSEFEGESEILFMIGSIFRLNSVNRSSDGKLWIIRMTLCSENDSDLKTVLVHMKKQLGSGETNLRTLGKVLWKMGKLGLAEFYLNRLLNDLPPKHPLLGDLYEDLGEIAALAGDYDKSVQYQQKSLEYKDPRELIDTIHTDDSRKQAEQLIPSTNFNEKTKQIQNGVCIAGGYGSGDELNQLNSPHGMYIDDDDQSIYVADWGNHRIVKWKYNAKNGEVVAGGNRNGNRIDQLSFPTDMIVDKKNDSVIICDWGNRRVVRWSRRNGTNVVIIISNIRCSHLAMDNDGDLYVSDIEKHEVRRWKKGQRDGTIIAGGNGKGCQLNQLDSPTHIFVDQDYAIYISDENNHRVMKWMKGAKEGIVVAGGQGEGDDLTQLSRPAGVIVDQLGRIYVSDCRNHRIMRWSKESKDCSIVVGGNGKGEQPNELNSPNGLSFNRQGNLCVVDQGNHRVQTFYVDSNRN
ncbi:unnamed protein product [Rotaria sp. Silwood2]|nr:unnamed protein product [Rotaria sp. Silwood2]CAF3398208.1 unnamed protein product [Rotaria sp. Silwood2]CAF4322447.1 unnamed protein product [Rotaria sp. Silwood2]CAF4445005.1 unnamed protein product [Rotaria sp. Silwood2]